MRKFALIFSLLIVALFCLPSVVQAYTPLERPDLVRPPNGEVLSGSDITFKWDESDFADHFRLQVEDDYGHLLFNEKLSESICNEGGSSAEYGYTVFIGSDPDELDLDFGERYSWKVKAYDGSDESYWSYTKDFYWRDYSPYPPPYDEPYIRISPYTGESGDLVDVYGYGWDRYDDIGIYYEGDRVESFGNGSHRDWVETIRATGGSGMHSIRAIGDSSGISNYCWFNASGTTVTMEILPNSGKVGTSVKVYGDYWPERETVIVTFDGIRIVTATTESDGKWSTTFLVPSSPAGYYKVDAYSESVYTNEVNDLDFEVIPSIELKPNTINANESYLIVGEGFEKLSTVRVTCDSKLGSITSNSVGRFTLESISPKDGGTYSVEASDSRGNKASATLLVQGTITVIPNRGAIGEDIRIAGSGFTGEEVNITYDGRFLTTSQLNKDGNFSVSVEVPTSPSGTHTIIVTDSIKTMSVNFEVENDSPLTPSLFTPYEGDEVSTLAKFTWSTVSDPSGVNYTIEVATDSGMNELAYTNTTSDPACQATLREGRYYWRVKAIDGAGNDSTWSDVRSFSVNGIPGWVWGAVGVLGAGVLATAGTLIARRKKS